MTAAAASPVRPAPRSLLFVPGDSERKQAKAIVCPADLLILDLEDSVAAASLPAARARVRELLETRPDRTRQQLWVRVNPPSSGTLFEDLEAVFSGRPDGLVLPKIAAPFELAAICDRLASLEARDGLSKGTTRLIVIATETPQAVLSLHSYPTVLGANEPIRQRLAGLTWGAEDLSAAMGVSNKIDEVGNLTFTFQLARTLCALTAAALEVQAIDGVHQDFRDTAGLARAANNARRDGFSGKLAIHPDQVEVINAAFRPSEDEVAWARKVTSAFASPGAGVASIDGKMLDRPHLVQAQRILALAGRMEI